MKEYITVHALGTFRYQLLEKDGVFYLRDHDLAWWGIVFPPLQWFFPQHVMRIQLSKEEIFEKLTVYHGGKNAHKEKKRSIWDLLIVPLAVLTGGALTPLILRGDVHLSLATNIIITILVIASALSIRFSMHKAAERVVKELPKEVLVKEKVYFLPRSSSHTFKITLASLFIMPLMLVGLVGWAGTETGVSNGIIWFFGFIVLFLWTLMGIQTEFGENKARIIFQNDQSVEKKTEEDKE